MDKRADSPVTGPLVDPAFTLLDAADDDLFARHVVEPQHRLTRGIGLRRGDRVVDLACGTGAETVRMLKEVSPGEVVAVDRCEENLRRTVARAARDGLAVTPLCARPEDVVETAREESFDVVAIRFSLGQSNWHKLLPRTHRILRAGGRVGVVTSLATSAPQAYAVYLAMAEDLGIQAAAPRVPRVVRDLEEALALGGFAIVDAWTQPLRLRFATGDEAARWILASGYAAHPQLAQLSADAIADLAKDFARRLEDAYEDEDGLPIDFDIAGVVAAKYSAE